MLRTGIIAVVVAAALAGACVAVVVSPWWWLAAVPLAVLGVVGVWDLVQRRHSVLRNYPVIGHARFLLERIRPELQQYF
ncbi:FMN-binding glutamate synthase family protein, partial [Streptomyces sp. SAS_260]